MAALALIARLAGSLQPRPVSATAASHPGVPMTPITTATTFVFLLARGQFTVAERHFSPTMQVKMPVARLQHFWSQLIAGLGAFRRQTGAAELPRYGPHAVFASRYDDHGLWIENEWGLDWGRGGYAELSWDLVRFSVREVLAISGVVADRTAPVPKVTPGPRRLGVGGVPHVGDEVTIGGTGFRPREAVTLFGDGRTLGHWPVTPWGTIEVQLAVHPIEPAGPHNQHWPPGRHVVLARGSYGDVAEAVVVVAPPTVEPG